MTWQVFAASITGSSHVAFGVGAQDAVRTTYPTIRAARNNGSVVAPPLLCVVADGLGSRSRSAEAANIAVGAYVESFLEVVGTTDLAHCGPDDIVGVLRQALAGCLRRYASALSTLAPIGEFDGATTLGVTYLTAEFVGVLSVGDAFVVTTRSDGTSALVLAPESAGEYANQTAHLHPDLAAASAETFVVVDPEIVAVALSTDGLADVMLAAGVRSSESVPHAGFFTTLYEELISGAMDGPKLNRLLAKLSGDAADDLTLAIAWRDHRGP